jgi:cystathionine beta-synthase
MPDKMSREKIDLLRAYGAEVVMAPTDVPPDSPQSYYRVADRLTEEIRGAFQPNQYFNPANPQSHYQSTGPELWEQLGERITHLVAGVGTGGTITGTTQYLRQHKPDIEIVGADPEGSIYSGGEENVRPYLVEGVGEDFWPTAYDPSVPDEVIGVSDGDSFHMTRRLAREEGLLVGGSCGMAVVAALEVARRLGPDDVVVVILPDSGRGYLTKIFNDEWMASYGFLGASSATTVGDVLRGKSGELPALVHTHPTETVRDAVAYLREYAVSQMPVVTAEPPVMAGEVSGSVSERDLLDALFTGRAHLADPVSQHMGDKLPMIGALEPVAAARVALEKADAILVAVDGKPAGVLTRADLLGFLAD